MSQRIQLIHQDRPVRVTNIVSMGEPQQEVQQQWNKREIYEGFDQQIRKISNDWNRVKNLNDLPPPPVQQQQQQQPPKAIVLKETKYVRVPYYTQQPDKVVLQRDEQNSNAKVMAKVRKRITYSFFDDYEPQTRIYTLDDNNGVIKMDTLYDSKNKGLYNQIRVISV